MQGKGLAVVLAFEKHPGFDDGVDGGLWFALQFDLPSLAVPAAELKVCPLQRIGLMMFTGHRRIVGVAVDMDADLVSIPWTETDVLDFAALGQQVPLPVVVQGGLVV